MAKQHSAQFTDECDDVLAALGIDTEPMKKASKTPREERIIAGFEAIQGFEKTQGHLPKHGKENDIFERLYAVRLDGIRASEECKQTVADLDTSGLLSESATHRQAIHDMDNDALLAALNENSSPVSDLTTLVHVKSVAERQMAEKKAAEEMGQRLACDDFEPFQALFDSVQLDLKLGNRLALALEKQANINQGDWFILNGQIAYIKSVGEKREIASRHDDARLRIIFDNATESNMLLRSLQKALLKDVSARRIIQNQKPLFDAINEENIEEEDIESGTIYVLRSQSNHEAVLSYGNSLHKIGVTGNDLNKRLANAKNDPTFLMAEVEVVAHYELFNINRVKLENLLHRFFETAKADIEIMDRFGQPTRPREWFLVPLFVIDQVVEKIKNQTLQDYQYDASHAQLIPLPK